jgi:hypothetical protein
MSSRGFEPVILAMTWLQTYALEFTATGISIIAHRYAEFSSTISYCHHNEDKADELYQTAFSSFVLHKRNTLTTATDFSKFCYRVPFEDCRPALSGTGVSHLRNTCVRHDIVTDCGGRGGSKK